MQSLEALQQELDNLLLKYRILRTSSGGSVVVLERGARVIGAFVDDTSPNFLWTKLEALVLDSTSWVSGGDRIWYSPEIEFHIPDDTRTDSYEVQQNMDPGSYQFIGESETEYLMTQRSKVRAFRAQKTVELDIGKKLSLSEDPLRGLISEASLYAFVGYEQETELAYLYQPTDLTISLWSILQVPFTGQAFISTHTTADYTDFIVDQYTGGVTVVPAGIVMEFNGEQRYKISVKSAYASGRLAYFKTDGADNCTLIVRNFAVNPSGHYPDVSFRNREDVGYCAQLYKDDGSLGFFGELEYHTASINLKQDNPIIRDKSQVWCYSGNKQTLDLIAQALLGYSFS